MIIKIEVFQMEKTNNLIWGGVGAILVVNGISYYTNKAISVQSVVIQTVVVIIICALIILFRKRAK